MSAIHGQNGESNRNVNIGNGGKYKKLDETNIEIIKSFKLITNEQRNVVMNISEHTVIARRIKSKLFKSIPTHLTLFHPNTGF